MFKKTLLSAAALLAAGTLSASVFAAPTTVEGTGVGKHGDITVAVTFDAGKIQDIKIVKNAENPILAKKVFTDLQDEVVAFSSTDVDLVSGATFSAKGFIDAVNDAAKKAGVTLAKADKKALKEGRLRTSKTSSYDVVVIGAAVRASPPPSPPGMPVPTSSFSKDARRRRLARSSGRWK